MISLQKKNYTTKFVLNESRIKEITDHIKQNWNSELLFWIKFAYVADKYARKVLDVSQESNAIEKAQISDIKLPKFDTLYKIYRM